MEVYRELRLRDVVSCCMVYKVSTQSRMLFTRFPSYYVGTAGHVSNETIQRYIERQKEAAEEQ